MTQVNNKSSESSDPQENILKNASQTHLRLHRHVRELTDELRAVYEREIKLLKIIDKRDKQLAQDPSKRKIRAQSAKQSSAIDQGISPEEHALVTKELEQLRARYTALSNSKLGRLQRWYWRTKAGK